MCINNVRRILIHRAYELAGGRHLSPDLAQLAWSAQAYNIMVMHLTGLRSQSAWVTINASRKPM